MAYCHAVMVGWVSPLVCIAHAVAMELLCVL